MLVCCPMRHCMPSCVAFCSSLCDAPTLIRSRRPTKVMCAPVFLVLISTSERHGGCSHLILQTVASHHTSALRDALNPGALTENAYAPNIDNSYSIESLTSHIFSSFPCQCRYLYSIQLQNLVRVALWEDLGKEWETRSGEVARA